MYERYLFRGRDSYDKKTWHEGSLYISKDGETYILKNSSFVGEDEDILKILACKVAHETVGQCTGVKDIYDNKLFQDDFVACKCIHYGGRTEVFKGKIIWSEYSCQWQISIPICGGGAKHASLGVEGVYIKLGNAYDDPKLLQPREATP